MNTTCVNGKMCAAVPVDNEGVVEVGCVDTQIASQAGATMSSVSSISSTQPQTTQPSTRPPTPTSLTTLTTLTTITTITTSPSQSGGGQSSIVFTLTQTQITTPISTLIITIPVPTSDPTSTGGVPPEITIIPLSLTAQGVGDNNVGSGGTTVCVGGAKETVTVTATETVTMRG